MNSSSKSNYRHSEVFSVLKTNKETLKTNLTTNQYSKTLDLYLLNAVTPIIDATTYYDGYLSKMLAWQTENFRRKLSMKSNINLPSLIMSFLLQQDIEGKIGAWKELYLDRAAIMESVRNFLDILQPYVQAQNCELPMPANYGGDELSYWTYYTSTVEKSLNSSKPLMPVIQQAEYWLYQATEFKRVILEKYIRLCLMHAQRDYVAYFNCQVKLDDIIQQYIVAASRAIDKCDAQQGVLTSHIINWFLTARNLLNKQRLQESKESSFESLEELNLVLESQTDPVLYDALVGSPPTVTDEIDQVRHVARLADPEGYGRLMLDIEEQLPEATRKLLLTFSRQRGAEQ